MLLLAFYCLLTGKLHAQLSLARDIDYNLGARKGIFIQESKHDILKVDPFVKMAKKNHLGVHNKLYRNEATGNPSLVITARE